MSDYTAVLARSPIVSNVSAPLPRRGPTKRTSSLVRRVVYGLYLQCVQILTQLLYVGKVRQIPEVCPMRKHVLGV
jgi:hypothetical protein